MFNGENVICEQGHLTTLYIIYQLKKLKIIASMQCNAQCISCENRVKSGKLWTLVLSQDKLETF